MLVSEFSGVDMKPQKAWEDIAKRVSREQDPQKLSELVSELLDALDQQAEQKQPKQSERTHRKSV